jgi:hypothetical protein
LHDRSAAATVFAPAPCGLYRGWCGQRFHVRWRTFYSLRLWCLGDLSAPAPTTGRPSTVVRFDVYFITAALAYAVLGILLGIGMGIAESFAYAHVHAHINLLGWATLCLYGLVHRGWPDLRHSPLARIQFWLAMVGTPIFLIGLPFAMFRHQPAGAIIGSLIVATGAVLFLVMFMRKVTLATRV